MINDFKLIPYECYHKRSKHKKPRYRIIVEYLNKKTWYSYYQRKAIPEDKILAERLYISVDNLYQILFKHNAYIVNNQYRFLNKRDCLLAIEDLQPYLLMAILVNK